MAFKDAVFLTLINSAACLALPKLLSAILAKRKSNQASPIQNPENARIEITTFPYCTVHAITGSQFCKFSPHFCARCSNY